MRNERMNVEHEIPVIGQIDVMKAAAEADLH